MSVDSPILEARGISKSFGGLAALRDVNFSVRKGSVHAIIGPNGAGKSTLISVASGFMKPDKGQIFLRGECIDRLSAQDRVCKGLVRTFQDVRGFPRLTVFENILLGSHVHGPRGLSDFVVRSGAIRRFRRSESESVLSIMDAVGLSDDSEVELAVLPFGKQRMVGLARAMASRPEVILLDEPGAGLSKEEMEVMVEAIRTLVGQGISLLLVEHHMSMIEQLSDEVTVLDFGQVICHGRWSDIRTDVRVKEAYLGGALTSHAAG